MKPAAFSATLFVGAMVTAHDMAFATQYADNPNPACRVMRNEAPDAPYPAEPNRADTRAAMTVNSVAGAFPKAFRLLVKIDSDGTDALAPLPPTVPRIDLVIDRHLTNLVWARGVLGNYFETGRLGSKDLPAAAVAYQRAVDTSFIDDRGCKHWVLASLETYKHLAGMYVYGIGVPADRAKAREVLAQGGAETAPLLAALDQNKLPSSYRELVTPPPPPQTGPTIEEKQKALLKAFGVEIDPEPGPWFGTLLTAALFILVLGVAATTAWEMGVQARTDPAAPRGIFAAYEVVRSTFGRLDLLLKALLALFIGLVLLRYFFNSSWNWVSSPWISAGFDYALILVMVVLIGTSFFNGIEALRGKRPAQAVQVHGDARPAGEEEAKKAARGVAVGPSLDAQEFRE
jgi:hypothetical protein